jgi:OOP family OmpA-OmpF porin
MLSLKRANIAQEYFIINGISPNRIKTLGKGATNPKYSNETLEGRLKNKRVELEFN